MAHAATYTDVYPKAGVLTRLMAWTVATMDTIAETNPRMRRVRNLQAMTDTQLAALRIKREDIVHHVFRDVYYR